MYPNPVTLLGANVEGRANFMSLGWVSRVNAEPPYIGIGVNKAHHTIRGILENKTFSINFPIGQKLSNLTRVFLNPKRLG